MVIGLGVAVVSMILVVLQGFNVNLGLLLLHSCTSSCIFIGILFSVSGLYFRRLEFTGIGLLYVKTIDAMISNSSITQSASIVI